MSDVIRIGTRGSKLALIQTDMVRAALASRFPHARVEVEVIKTRGDKILDSPLSQIGGKGLFIREIEEALADRRIDAAVHSLKDLPTTLPQELTLAGVLARDDPRDALVSREGRSLAELRPGARVATSSLRRRAQLLAAHPRLEVVDIRGNVDTRLAKLDQGHCEALVMAACGLTRVGAADLITEYLDPEVMLPAVCQGIIAVETRLGDERIGPLVAAISDLGTLEVAEAERSFLHRVEGGCQVPVGCLAVVADRECTVTGLVASLDGTRVIRRCLRGESSQLAPLAAALAESILDEGGAEILADIRNIARQ